MSEFYNKTISIIKSLDGVKVGLVPELPKFYTDIDNVDISVDVCGIK